MGQQASLNKNIKSLPLIMNWGIWLARNATIFRDKPSLPEILVIQGLRILEHFPQEKEDKGGKFFQYLTVDSNYRLDFFYGAS
jgi:hypothetical protein